MARALLSSCVLWLLASGCIMTGRARPPYEAHPQVLNLPSVVVYQGSTGPMSYQTAVGKDAKRMLPTQRVHGRACQRGFQLPLFWLPYAIGGDAPRGLPLYASAGWGEGAFRQAVDDARKRLPRDAVLFDVRADLDVKMILSIYREQCLVIDAGVLVPVPAPNDAPQIEAPVSDVAPGAIPSPAAQNTQPLTP